jgi:hypothetical protein
MSSLTPPSSYCQRCLLHELLQKKFSLLLFVFLLDMQLKGIIIMVAARKFQGKFIPFHFS